MTTEEFTRAERSQRALILPYGVCPRAETGVALENKGGKFVSPSEVARIFVVLGERDAVMEWLTKACEERVGDMIYVKWWPEFEPLRADPRFRELLRHMKM